jgi:hypothetical protein
LPANGTILEEFNDPRNYQVEGTDNVVNGARLPDRLNGVRRQ